LVYLNLNVIKFIQINPNGGGTHNPLPPIQHHFGNKYMSKKNNISSTSIGPTKTTSPSSSCLPLPLSLTLYKKVKLVNKY
jgi:hypothetical protein